MTSQPHPRAAIILAAGQGTRMKSPLPKVLHPVGARAMLDHAIDAAEALGCERIVVVVGAHSPEVRAPGLFERFIEDYTAHIADESRPFEGCVAALDRLSARGAILCVATNKRTDLSATLIEALGLTRHFAFVAGPDAVSARKPSGVHILEAVQKAGGDPARCVMVGDSTTDTKAARDAGVPCIVVSFGYNDAPPAEMGGDVTIDHYDGFEDALAGVTGA